MLSCKGLKLKLKLDGVADWRLEQMVRVEGLRVWRVATFPGLGRVGCEREDRWRNRERKSWRIG